MCLQEFTSICPIDAESTHPQEVPDAEKLADKYAKAAKEFFKELKLPHKMGSAMPDEKERRKILRALKKSDLAIDIKRNMMYIQIYVGDEINQNGG
jgi:hypothetical protein